MAKVDRPEIHAVVYARHDVLELSRQMYDAKGFLEPEKLVRFLKATEALHFRALHQEDRPFIKKDAQGRETLYLAWSGNPGDPLDTDYIFALKCPLTYKDGIPTFIPEMAIRGTEANIVVAGGMTCCGGTLQTHTSVVMDNGIKIDDARIPSSGIRTNAAYWLKQKVHMASGPQAKGYLNHLVIDLLRYRYPDNPHLAHDCSTAPNYGAANLTFNM